MFDNEDIRSVLSRDPAAESAFEVWLCYPGYRAVRRHRRAHRLWEKGWRVLARWVSQRTVRLTGIEIHPAAKIGKGLFIDHGSGVVIGETTEIGDNVTLYQGVTLGGTGKDTGKRHPTIGSNVVIGAGAKVLGPFRVGDGAKVGAGAVVLKEVPPGATVVGNPGRVVRRRDGTGGTETVANADLDQVHLPDPVKERLDRLMARMDQVEKCMVRKAMEIGCDECEDKASGECLRNRTEGTRDEDL